MTADPMPPSDCGGADWLRPPPEGYSAEDLDHLHDLPPHTELIDGSLVFVSPQARFHMLVIRFLQRELDRQAPGDLEAVDRMTITLGPRQRPEPDVLVVRRENNGELAQTTYQPADTVLVVEVVSPESVVRDRERKPQLYAKAGIPHFWRIENADGRAVVYVYELDPATGIYEPAGIFHDRLRVGVPFAIDLDLTQAARGSREGD